MLEGNHIGRARIKTGSVVGQDRHFVKWEDGGEVFDVYEFIKGRKRLEAFGYGMLGGRADAYGNGALYVKDEDLIWEVEVVGYGRNWPDVATVLG